MKNLRMKDLAYKSFREKWPPWSLRDSGGTK